jgi:hypothetical protein
MTIYTTLAVKKADRKIIGGRLFNDGLGAGLEVVAVAQAARDDNHLAAAGRAAKVDQYLRKHAIPTMIRLERQRAHLAKKIDADERNLRKQILGAHDALDGERRMVLRAASPSERLRLMSDHHMQMAALRGGSTLSGVPDEQLDRHMDAAIERLAPEALVARQHAVESMEFVDASIATLRGEIAKAPVVAMGDGSVRAYHAPELAAVIKSTEVPPLSEMDRSLAELSA